MADGRRLANGRHCSQRHDRVDRPRPDTGSAGRRLHACTREQGVADRRRSAGQGGSVGRSDRADRFRAFRAGPMPSRRARCRGAPVDPDGQRRAVSRPPRRRPRDSDTGPSPCAPDLAHGSGGHHQLGHLGEQGPRADRGAPAFRPTADRDRRRRAPAVDRALDGRVHRRLDVGPMFAARHAAADRPRARLAAAGTRRRPLMRLDDRAELDLRAARRRGVSRRPIGAAGRNGRWGGSGHLQRRQRGGGRSLSGW